MTYLVRWFMIVLDYVTLIACYYLFNTIDTKQIKVFQFSTFFSTKMIYKICKKLKCYKNQL